MANYFDELNETVREYFHILSPEIPSFLNEYIQTPAMQRISKISMSCGTDYTKIFNNQFWYSNLDHSVGVALIVWNFTKDKKQTLAGLFHDIATPTFKHCIDFMNGDHEKQESTEELTTDIIKNSKEIMNLLEKDGITLEEVNDYKIYPIADNDTPKLSADRFEYNFSSGMVLKKVWNLEDIREIYNNIIILKNENGIEELGFKDIKIAEKYINIVSSLWPEWISSRDKMVMQFIADITKKMSEEGYLTVKDLYTLSEKEVLYKIENCNNKHISNCFKKFRQATEVYEANEKVEGKYCINIKAKKRYVIPLVNLENDVKRINEVSIIAKNQIENYLKIETKPYAYLNFDF